MNEFCFSFLLNRKETLVLSQPIIHSSRTRLVFFPLSLTPKLLFVRSLSLSLSLSVPPPFSTLSSSSAIAAAAVHHRNIQLRNFIATNIFSSLSLSLFRCAVGCRADSILTSDWRRRFYNLCLIDPVRFLLRKQSEHDGAAISLIEISLSFFFPPVFCLFSSLCVVDTVWQCVFIIHYMWCRILLSGGICRRTCRARDRSLKHGVAEREISTL